MRILLYIIVTVIAIAVVFVVAVFLHTIYELATGKVSKEEQERRIAIYDRYKEQDKLKRLQKKQAKRRGGLLHFLSYPSPLNRWGLWK